MKLKMCSGCAIFFNMDSIQGHCARQCAENRRLVHVIPEAVHVVATLEDVVGEEITPEFLRIFIQKVNPCRVTWPTFSIKRLATRGIFANKDISDVIDWLVLLLQFHAVCVDEVVVCSFDMRVHNEDKTASSILYFFIHLLNLLLCEVFRVKFEVFVASRIIILLSPLDITPQHIDWEAIHSEVCVPFHKHFSRYWVPFAKVES